MRKVSDERKREVLQWIEAAVADGWTREATYKGNEPMERASHLTKDGYVVSTLTREPIPDKHGPGYTEYDLSAWGPDALALKLPIPYSFAALEANMHLCGECNQMKEVMSRVAFCNRVCADCKPAAKDKYETRGWCD